MEPVELRLPDLLLRPWRDSDARQVLDALREPAIVQWNPGPVGIDLAGALAWVRGRADWSDGTHASFAVTARTGGSLLGSVSLHRIADGNAAIGYWTCAGTRRRGVASKAVGAVTDWAFDTLGLHRIELCHAVPNTASCRVASRVGYPLEGTLRESYRCDDGQRYDEHLHARLATDP